MATLTSQIQALIAYANETTGKGDTQLGDAVKSLVDGYGQGDGSYGIAEGEIAIATNLAVITVEHKVPSTPYLFVVERQGEVPSGSTNTIKGIATEYRDVNDVQLCAYFRANNANGVYASKDNNLSTESCSCHCYSSATFLAGTYKYKIIYGKDGKDGNQSLH